jgi:acetylornithine deacetylase
MKHDFVVQRSTVPRMRMANQRGVRSVRRARVQQGFEASRGTLKKKRADRIICSNHYFRVQRTGRARRLLEVTLCGFVTSAIRGHRLCCRRGFQPFCAILIFMDPVAFTRQLVDIESISGNEGPVGDFLQSELSRLGFNVEKMRVEGPRHNVFATSPGHPHPAVVFSTHMDTVPPFIPSSEDSSRIYGRGSCDAKGIIAAQVAAALRLREEGIHVGLLYLVGEERDSLGAKVANEHAAGCKFLINGEPTENHIAIASKGTLRVELTASGKMAHSAYPELGESAIEKLIEALHRLQRMKLPTDPDIGPCTMNIGVIEGGRAPNVIPDHARAQLLFRLVGPSGHLRDQIAGIVGDLAKVDFTLELAFMRFRTFEGVPSMVAAFTTDIPFLGNWGTPLLLGPGSIHVAHTDGEFLEKSQLHEAVELYCKVAKQLS